MTIENMKKCKQEHGYTLAQIAEYSGVPIGTIQKIFSGETKCPRYDTILAIERVLSPGSSECIINEPAMEYNAAMRRQGSYDVKDYYAMPEDRRIELIDGVIYNMSAPTSAHQSIAGEVFYQLKQQIKEQGGECMPFFAPVDVRLDCDERTMVQPDVLILCDRSKLTKWGIDGAPDFVLEIISDSTRKKDMYIKSIKYLDAGVREYWIIDADNRRLIKYDYASDSGPELLPLKGRVGLSIYNGELCVNLDELNQYIS